MDDTTQKRLVPAYFSEGDSLDVYELGTMISKTRMSFVYKASADGMRVALKIPFENDPILYKAINREGEALRLTGDGKHVPRLIHALYYPVPALAIELLPGKPLSNYAVESQAHREFFAFDFIETIRQAALNLEHVHQKGVLHKDVKPSNIMVTENNATKLIDFGVARLPYNHPLNSRDPELVSGTVRYMPPEQMSEPLSIGPSADVYALTRTLLELLVGLPSPMLRTFEDSDMKLAYEIMFYEKRESPPANANRRIKRRWSRWLKDCVEENESKRCQSAAELADRLETILKEAGWKWQPLQATTPGNRLPSTVTCSSIAHKKENLMECVTTSYN